MEEANELLKAEPELVATKMFEWLDEDGSGSVTFSEVTPAAFHLPASTPFFSSSVRALCGRDPRFCFQYSHSWFPVLTLLISSSVRGHRPRMGCFLRRMRGRG
jgi:hypothetical protein